MCTFIFKILSFIEKAAAMAQGKGFGSATIRQEVKLLQSLSPNKPTLAVDIGGNIGNYTAELRRRNPNLEIHIFEPSATNLEKLNARFRSDPLIKLVPFAVSDQVGEALLFSNVPGSGLGSLTQRRLDHFNINFDVEEKIQTIRFEDYWLSQLESRNIDLVKIDIEGHEISALHGFGKALKATKALQFEFGGCNIDTRTFFQDFWYFFQENDFDIYRVTPIGAAPILRYSELDEFFTTTNYVAINRQQPS